MLMFDTRGSIKSHFQAPGLLKRLYAVQLANYCTFVAVSGALLVRFSVCVGIA